MRCHIMRVAWLLPLFALSLASSSRAAAPVFAPGQVWNYHSRPQDKGSELRIWRIDPGPSGRRVMHISVIGLTDDAGHALPEIQHLALTERALRASVTTRADSDAVFPDPSAAYKQWKRTSGAAYSGTLVQLVAIVVRSLRAR